MLASIQCVYLVSPWGATTCAGSILFSSTRVRTEERRGDDSHVRNIFEIPRRMNMPHPSEIVAVTVTRGDLFLRRF